MPFNLQASIGLDGSKFAAGVAQVKAKARDLKASINDKLNDKLANQFAGVFGAGAIAAASKETLSFAGTIEDLHQRTGASREGLQRWGYAAKQNGSDVQTAGKYFENLGIARKKAFEGNEDALQQFKDFGVTMDDLKNKRLEDIGLQIGNAVRNGDVQKLGDSLKAVGGKAALELVPAFKNGLAEAFAQAPVLSDEMISELDEIGDAIDKLAGQFRTILAPAIIFVADKLGKTLDLLKITFGARAAFWGTLAGGGSLKDADAAEAAVKNEVLDARIAREAEKTKKRERKVTPFTDEEVEAMKKPEKAKKQLGAAEADTLAKIGGFLGNAGLGNPILTVAEEQLEVTRRIERNTNPTGRETATFSA